MQRTARVPGEAVRRRRDSGVVRSGLVLLLLIAFAGTSGIDETNSTFAATTGSEATFSAASAFPDCSDQTVLADSDTTVSEAAPATNYGTDLRLAATSSPTANRRMYVHFTLPALSTGCRLTGASLRLRNHTITGSTAMYASGLAASWAETGLTWSTQPGLVGDPANSNGTCNVFDVYHIVKPWYGLGSAGPGGSCGAGGAGGTDTASSRANYGFVVRYTTEGGASEMLADSREGTSAPLLTLTLVPTLTNPGFETGTSLGWTCTNNAVVTAPVHSGTYAMQLTSPGTTVTCTQSVSGLVVGRDYTFAVWVNTSGNFTVGARSPDGTNSVSVGGSGSGTWQRITIDFTATSTAEKLYVRAGTSSTVVFDDATLD